MADADTLPARTKKAKKTKPKDKEEIPLDEMEGSTSKFEQLMQQAVSQATEGAKTKKKKKKNDQAESVLESLRKGEGLQKDEDAAIKANTYDPDNSPKNEKSNKRRQKLRELEGKDNDGFEVVDETKLKKKKKKAKGNTDQMQDTELDVKKDKGMIISELEPSERKKKKKKKPPDEEEPVPTPEEVLTPKGDKKKKKKPVEEVEEQLPAPSEEEVLTPKGGKKKKTKKTTTPEEESPMAPSPEPTSPVLEKKKKKKKKDNIDEQSPSQPLSEEDAAASTTDTPTKKKKKKKVKKEGDTEEGSIGEDGEEKEEEDEDEEVEDEGKETAKAVTNKKPKKGKKKIVIEEDEEKRALREGIEDEGKILSVLVHRTDKLKNDFHIMHPLVRVHIVNEETGQNLQKQQRSRAVSSYFETKNENVTTIIPIMTKAFDFKKRKSTLPVWEEHMIFNENFNYFIQDYPKVIVFFELLDIVSMNTASQQYSSGGSEGGWHRIAWAFLKIRGVNDKLNVGSKVRLQLFEVPKIRPSKGQVEVYQWWASTQQRKPYPSTLYVTLKGIQPSSNIEPSTRSLFATQEEVGSKTYADLKKSMKWKDHREEARKTLSSWTRLAGQMCRIPNNLFLTLPAGRKGCYVVKFSHDGRNLACACQDKDNYPILVYEIPSGELLGKFIGHFGIVYDLSWSRRNTHLVSASSDGTVRVWSLDRFESAEKLLPHPSFVYGAQFHPRVDSIVVTGCYDQVIRVWDVESDTSHGQLKQELEAHMGNVNALCFDDDGQKMYSADSKGVIVIWNVYVTEAPSQKGFVRDWNVFKKIEDPDMKDVPINHLELHHSGRRLLVHCRDNILRMLDLRIQRVMQKYIGALNFREQIRSSITPCGSFVFSGSEDNFAYAWNTDTGDQVAMYSELNYRHPVTDIHYHPRDHMFAVCSLGDNQPVVVYDYDADVAHRDAGLSPRYITPEPSDEIQDTTLQGTMGGFGSTTKGATLTTSQVLTKDEFQTHTTARLEKVMKKLNSATSQMMAMPSMELPGVPASSPRLGHTGLLSMDQSMTPRTMMTSPQMFSPHAPRTMTGVMQQQQFMSQKMYMKNADSEWRPGFTDVGRSGRRSPSPTFIGRPPSISLTATQGKAQFSFQAPAGKAVPSYPVVRALYDYKAQRSDELTIFKGDIISVLYKDSEHWWMGELSDGQQGFFPSNYVSDDRTGGDDFRETDTLTPVRKSVTALKTKSGDLKFVSGAEESDEDLLSAAKKNRKKKRGSKDSTAMSDAGSVDSRASRRSSKPPTQQAESEA